MKKQTYPILVAAILAAAPVLSFAQASNNPFTPVGPAKPAVQRPVEPPKPMTQVNSDNPFPPVNSRLFTASDPTPATVESFLKALWGYDAARIWSVTAIERTSAEGVTKVSVLISSRNNAASLQRATFYVLPDRKHVLSGDAIIPFGAKPFAETRKMLQDRADGPAKGAASKDLELVEFGDLHCQRCADADSLMDLLAKDFPQARIVFENIPVEGHAASYQAAAFGVCVARQSTDLFFKYVDNVFDSQAALTADGAENALKTAAGKAGVDTAAMSACAAEPATKSTVTATVALGKDVGVEATPVLFINGRMISLAGNVPYETIRSLVLHQAAMDDIQLPIPAPHLTTLQ